MSKISDPLEGGQNLDAAPPLKIGYASLNVSDLDKSLDFYQTVLGFNRITRSSKESALLSVYGSDSYLIKLLQAQDSTNNEIESIAAANSKRAGLYHFAILLPKRKYLADMLQNLVDKREQVYFEGLADHLVSESIYIRDPDFNGVEIYRDRPYSEWKRNSDQIQMATLPLDTNDLLKESTEKGWHKMPAKTTMGHVHLHVRDLSRSKRFYQDVLGLHMTGTIPSAAFFAAGKYHHHVATNTWLGTNISGASPNSIGLNHFSVELKNREEFEQTMTRLASHIGSTSDHIMNSKSKSFFIHDPDGISIKLQR